MAPLRVGIVGVGSLGRHHARLLPSITGAVPAGCFDIDTLRAAQVAAEVGTTAWPSLDALLDATDAVVVAVPAEHHAPVGLRALRRGRHVLMEKPLAATPDGAEALASAASDAGVVLQPGHSERFNPRVLSARAALSAAPSLAFRRAAPWQRRGTDVSVVLDLMIHDLDLALWLDGGDVAAVEASGDAVDSAEARVVFRSGRWATFVASRVAARRQRVVALGGGANAVVDLDGRDDGAETRGDPLARELASFVRAAGGGPAAVSAEDGVAAVRLAHRVMDAAGLTAAATVG